METLPSPTVDDGRKGVIRPDGSYVPLDNPVNYDSFMNQMVDDVAYKSVNPDINSKRQEELMPHASNKASDPRLEDEVNQLIGEEWDYTHKYADMAKDDWLSEQKLAYNTKVKYLEYLGYQSQDKERAIEERKVWADAFTNLSIEVYGAPDPDVAKIIDAGGGEKIIEKYKPIYAKINEYFESQFGFALNVSGMEKNDDEVDARDIYNIFSDGLNQLKQNDSRWGEWRVIMIEGTDISCNQAERQIEIGSKRISKIKPKSLKALFTHEVLVHGLRAVNAKGVGIDSALPRYILAEEGLAKLSERAFASDDESILTSMENYSDMAAALGMIDGRKYTRKEIITRKINRYMDKGKPITERLNKQIDNSAARIFRGTPGSEEVSGVFTKDVSYFGGFVPIAEFIKTGLEKGQSINDIMGYLLSAKFDPNNPDHAEFMGEKLNERYFPNPPSESLF